MKLKNETQYDTRALSKLIRAILVKMGIKPQGYQINIRYRKSNGRVVGRASYSSKWILLLLTRGEQNLSELENTVEHEALHNLGVRHENMHSRIRYCRTTREETIKEKPPKQKQPRDLVKERYDNIIKKEREWATKLKRAESIYSKWQKKKKQYRAKHPERLQTEA